MRSPSLKLAVSVRCPTLRLTARVVCCLVGFLLSISHHLARIAVAVLCIHDLTTRCACKLACSPTPWPPAVPPRSSAPKAFLLDSSDSIDPSDFKLAKDFVVTVADRFHLETGKQQIALSEFSGWFLAEGTVATTQPAADGTCKPATFEGSDGVQNEIDTYCDYQQGECVRCRMSMALSCPPGSRWLRNEGDGNDYCLCRARCDDWRPAEPEIEDDKCIDSATSTPQFQGCFESPVEIVEYDGEGNAQSAGAGTKCYQSGTKIHHLFKQVGGICVIAGRLSLTCA
jgi:hypothetical protein